MNKLRFRLTVLMVLLALVSAASWLFYLTGRPVQGVLYARNIPMQIEGWSGMDLPVDDQTTRLLGTEDILFRVYTREGEPPAYLCVVFAENNRTSIHPPEVCYIASGWEVGEKKMVDSKNFTEHDPFLATQILIAKTRGEEQLVLYWYKAGDKFTSSVYSHQWNMALNQLLFRNATSSLIRLSTEIGPGGREEAQKRLNAFAEAAIPLIQKHLP